ncbi:MAG: diguanylate cyclase [Deltaproteobacteria bacterium]|nr:diguanylate cyclase [Deltaproteobacteria bacterium]
MDVTFVLIALVISILLQFAAAFFALRLIWITGRRRAWALIAIALSFMAVRRCIPLFRLISGDLSHIPDLSAELVALATSVLMVTGVAWIAPLFLFIKRSEKALRESEEKYRSLVEFTEDSVYLVDRNCRYLFMNEKCLSRLRLPIDKVIGRKYGEFHSPEEEKEFAKKVEEVFETGKSLQYEHRSLRDGRYFLRTLSPVKEPDGRTTAVTVISKDITERKKAEQQLAFMATHDPLTGLPNRILFNDRLTLALAQAQRNRQKLVVMFLDLDRFKDINDKLGHNVGDKLLQAVGDRLKSLLRKSDTVARMGGDEFLLLLPEIARMEDSSKVARKVLEAFHEPFVFNGHGLRITTSIGVAIFPNDGEDGDILMKNADIAMYRAKEQGRDNYQRYTPAMNAEALN